MDTYCSPYITHYSDFHFLFHNFHSQLPEGKFRAEGLGLRRVRAWGLGFRV